MYVVDRVVHMVTGFLVARSAPDLVDNYHSSLEDVVRVGLYGEGKSRVLVSISVEYRLLHPQVCTRVD